jgi:hypothetical protein
VVPDAALLVARPARCAEPQGREREMGRRGSSARAAALRRAQQAKAGRDAERVLRERQIEIALADYFEAVARAERVRAEARRKADAVLEAGEQAAGEPETAARDAVRRLRELACSVGEVAALCGISTAGVRELLAVAGTSGAAAAGSADPLPGPADRPGVSGHAG